MCEHIAHHFKREQSGLGVLLAQHSISLGVLSRLTVPTGLTSQRDSAIRLHYTVEVFKEVKDSDWSADHIAAHGVTLDEVREAVLDARTG